MFLSVLILQIFLFLQPLLFFPYFFNPYEFPKYYLFLFTVEFLSLLLLTNMYRKKIKYSFTPDWLFLFSSGYVIYMFFANLMGVNVMQSIMGSTYRYQGFLTLLCGFLLFIIVRILISKNKKTQDKLITSVVAGGVVVACIACLEFIALSLFHITSIPTYNGRLFATFGNPNFLGGYLVMVLPLVFGFPKLFERFQIKCAAGILIIAGILVSESRSSLITLIVIGIFLGIYSLRVSRACKMFLLVILFSFFAYSLFSFAHNVHFYRFSEWDTREIIWTEGVKAVSKSRFIGFGQENFQNVFPQNIHMVVDNAHNIFLETLLSGGIIGFLLFLSILFLAFRKSQGYIRLSLLAFLIYAQFNPLSIAHISLFWFLLSLIKDS